jgi:diaminopimelate decarboxylase
MKPGELVAKYGSPLWLADVDRFEDNLRAFRQAWRQQWPATRIAYSYKTNRLLSFLQAADALGACAEVVCAAEYELAALVVGTDPEKIVVDGPAKPDSLLARAGAAGALVMIDSIAELERAAAAGVRRVGLRVALESFTGARTRFGIPPEHVVVAARRAGSLGMSVQVLSTHLVSTDFDPASGRIVVSWPRPAAEHADAAGLLARLAAELAREGNPVAEIDLGGGFPAAADVVAHAREVARAFRDGGFTGGLVLEPGRALVADAVDLVFTVVAVKTLCDGSRCLVCDAGTNFLPGAVNTPPHIESADAVGLASPALVTGPLCLNVDVVHPRAELPALEPGSLLIARGVGAYQQAASTEFGEARPPTAVQQHGRWRLHRETSRIGVERQAA